MGLEVLKSSSLRRLCSCLGWCCNNNLVETRVRVVPIDSDEGIDVVVDVDADRGCNSGVAWNELTTITRFPQNNNTTTIMDVVLRPKTTSIFVIINYN